MTRGAQTLVYDAENHLVQAGTTRYVYNGDGQTVRKVDANNNQTVYIGQYVEAQFNATPPTAHPTWTALPATATFANTPTPTVTRTPTHTATFTPTRTPKTPTATILPTATETPITPAIPANQTWKFYYFAGAQRIAMRYKDAGSINQYGFLLSDHLPLAMLGVLREAVPASSSRWVACRKPSCSTRHLAYPLKLKGS